MANISSAMADYLASGMSDPGAIADGWQPICATASDRPREDNMWMMTSAILVLSMNAAFALLEAGCVSNKNTLNIMMKNIGDLTLGGIAWWAVGYVIAFPSTAKWGSTERFPTYVHDEAFWFFQWTFAATAATIDSGALAERVNFLSYCVLSTLITGVIYPVVVSWAWDGEGFLANMDPPFMDYAGGTIVHMLGASTAVVSCTMVGPRIGRFQDYVPSTNFLARVLCRRPMEADYYMVPPGASPIKPVTDGISMVWGVFFLWIGWYGFNPGAIGDIEGSGTYAVGRVTVNTTMGALGGGVMCFLLDLVLQRGKVRPESLALGVLSGLVSITAGVWWFSNGSSALIGALGSLISMAAKKALEVFQIDDVVTAIPIHGCCGAFGAIAIAFWAEPWGCTGEETRGLFYAENRAQVDLALRLLWTQVKGCAIICAWTMATTFVTIAAMNQVPILRFRVGRAIELTGADETEHSMPHNLGEFHLVMKSMLQGLVASSGTPEDMMVIFSETLQCLSVNHKLARLKHRHLEEADCNLIVTVSSLTQMGEVDVQDFAGRFCRWRTHFFHKMGFFVQAEIVAAEELHPGSEDLMRSFTYLAPRTTSIKFVDPGAEGAADLSWADEPFLYSNFSLPTGSEASAYIYLTVYATASRKPKAGSGIKIGEAYIPLRSSQWGGAHPSPVSTQGAVDLQRCGPTAPAPPTEAKVGYDMTIPGTKTRFSSRVMEQAYSKSSPRGDHSPDRSWDLPFTPLPPLPDLPPSAGLASMEEVMGRLREMEDYLGTLTSRNEKLEEQHRRLEADSYRLQARLAGRMAGGSDSHLDQKSL